MPRLPPSLIRHAYSIHPLLSSLLRECRDLPSAQNELRWLREHALTECQRHYSEGWRGWDRGSRPMVQKRCNNGNIRCKLRWKLRLQEMVQQRARGIPLQYILGDQPFGGLDILCRKGVLIPRPETESYTTRVANLLLSRFAPKKHDSKHEHGKHRRLPALRILDLCTGAGCIPLLLHSLLAPTFPRLQIRGVDISTPALKLARENLEHNIKLGNLSERARNDISFVSGDVLSGQLGAGAGGSLKIPGRSQEDEEETLERIFPHFTTTSVGVNHSSSSAKSFPPQEHSGNNTVGDPLPTSQKLELETDTDGNMITVLVSNPPYISPTQFINGTTARSVRKYEPRLALVPPLPAITHQRKTEMETEAEAETETDTPAAAAAATDTTDASTPTCSWPRRINTNEVAAATRQEDMFYPHILTMGLFQVDADLVVLECGDKGQAERVAEMARGVYGRLAAVDVWRCDGHGDAGCGFGLGPEDGDDGGARAVIVKRGYFLDNSKIRNIC
ncbi:hypothetical protein AJ78_07557 [Emergomyces pasteurianus Ep9510]|uniref:Uncharacterized protein n=1 Tax=Emergomyces pasteurianus Ep9510 TaxID=1447872 RepID=A0A1J9P4T2_9EURO|nr:hypothetical protein AJ78_07557 [Emergomyces pasteurianus Ep9510]